MFPTFRLEAPLPFQRQPFSPLYTTLEVDAFVDRFEAPRALRDPFSQAILRRPVALQHGDNEIENICAEETCLRQAMIEGRAGRPSATPSLAWPSTRLVLHRPMCEQLSRFYEAATERALEVHGVDSDRFRAMKSYIDASTYEMRLPVAPLLLASERASMAREALVPLHQAGVIVQQMRIMVERLLSRVGQGHMRLTRLETHRQALLIDLRELRQRVQASRRLLWRIMTPPTQVPLPLFQQWRELHSTMTAATIAYADVLEVEIPAHLALRSRLQLQEARQNFTRENDSRSSTP